MIFLSKLNQQKAIVSMADFSATAVTQLLDRASAFKAGAQAQVQEPTFAANLFFENSTRTHTSFSIAEQRLGLKTIEFSPQSSSVQKGETLYDTCLTMAALGVQLLVIRHPENAYYQQLLGQAHLPVALINAGDGSGEHPSQSLLDLLTIREEFGHFAGLKVAIVGDLAHSRVARSNMEILQALGAEIYFSGPAQWYQSQFERYGEYRPLDELVGAVDVLMLLRVQHERLASTENQAFSAAAYHQAYGLTEARAQRLQPQAIIMHPGPINRDVELASSLVESPHSRYYEQMQNGVYVRMAMIETVLQANGIKFKSNRRVTQ